MELVSANADPSINTDVLNSLKKETCDLNSLIEIVKEYHLSFNGASPMMGNFRGTWTLPMAYLNAYIGNHGKEKLHEGVGQVNETAVEALKSFTSLGKDASGQNKCTSEFYKKNLKELLDDVSQSDHVLLYGYSEMLSDVFNHEECQKKKFRVTGILAPPTGKESHLLTYTGALVVNSDSYSGPKREAIDTFLCFYTSLEFQNKLTMCSYLHEGGVQDKRLYVLPSRKDFYTDGLGAEDKIFEMFHVILMEHAVSVPNHGLATKVKEMKENLEKHIY